MYIYIYFHAKSIDKIVNSRSVTKVSTPVHNFLDKIRLVFKRFHLMCKGFISAYDAATLNADINALCIR
jgi:hypothetical protein